jgi:hypothetical protein
MTDDGSPAKEFSKGEKVAPSWSYQFLDLSPVEAGARLAPGSVRSKSGSEFAALNMVASDLRLALSYFTEANKMGMPDPENLISRALIHSAVTAYARPFKTGVREIQLRPDFFSPLGSSFDAELHDYLIDVRDKHVAHSVNEFERFEATTLMVGTPDGTSWRVAGMGLTSLNSIGLSLRLVEAAIEQISRMLRVLDQKIDEDRKALYEEERSRFARDGKWEIAPAFHLPDRKNVAKRRQRSPSPAHAGPPRPG